MTTENQSERSAGGGSMRTHILLASVVLVVFFPSGMLLHESGHYVAARLLGSKAHLGYRRVQYDAEKMTSQGHAVVQAAGPCVDVVFVVFGILYLRRLNRTSQRQVAHLGFWIATALVLSSLRWLKAPILGEGGSDEARISVLWGMRWYVIPGIMFPPTLFALVYLIRSHALHRTIIPLIIGFGAGMGSFVLWYLEIGPRILPV